MSDDIVARLRKEIRKRDREYPVELLPELSEAADEIERLRAERDEARCDACMTWAWMYRPSENAETEARKEAKRRSWDCFKEDKP